MTRDEYLLELQRRVATAYGYTDLVVASPNPGVVPLPGGPLFGTLHADEGPALVPRWPWDWRDAGELLAEFRWWSAGRYNSGRGYWFNGDGCGGEGASFEEVICRCWLAWKGYDLSDLPSVA